MKFYEHPAYIGYASEDIDKKRIKKFKKQYNKQGFDDSATWSLDFSIAKFILPRLKRFYEISDKVIEIDYHEGLRQAIEDIIEGFELQIQDRGFFPMEEQEKIDKAWKLLGEYHGMLWW